MYKLIKYIVHSTGVTYFFDKSLPSPIYILYRDRVYGFLMNFIEQHSMSNHNI